MTGDKEKPVAVAVNCEPELVTRLDAFTASMKRAQVAKRAMVLGLKLIEQNPTLLVSDTPAKPAK